MLMGGKRNIAGGGIFLSPGFHDIPTRRPEEPGRERRTACLEGGRTWLRMHYDLKVAEVKCNRVALEYVWNRGGPYQRWLRRGQVGVSHARPANRRGRERGSGTGEVGN